MRALLSIALVLFVPAGMSAETIVVDIEDVPIAADSAWFGPFTSRGANFSNYYNSDWNYWEGFAASSKTDTQVSGLAGQFNAITGGGAGGSAKYAVGYVGWTASPVVTFESEVLIDSVAITNCNYAYYSMLNGDAFSKKFGGPTGDDPDYFLLTVTGKDAAGAPTGTAQFYLADYRFADNGQDYIVNEWTQLGLSGLGSVKSLEFSLSSTDNDPLFGMNTPAYFVLDNLTYVPEPAGIGLLLAGAFGVLTRRRRKA